MTVVCPSDCQPTQCEGPEPLPKPSGAPAHDIDTSRRQSCDDGTFTIQVLGQNLAAESRCSAGLDGVPEMGVRSADCISKPAATIQRQWTLKPNKVAALRQIIAELEDETRAVNGGVKFPTAPSFGSAVTMVRIPVYIISL